MISYRTNDWKTVSFDTSDSTCSKYGFLSGVQLSTPRGNSMVIGVHDKKLWIHTIGNSGATYLGRLSEVQLLQPKVEFVTVSNTPEKWIQSTIRFQENITAICADNTGALFVDFGGNLKSFHPKDDLIAPKHGISLSTGTTKRSKMEKVQLLRHQNFLVVLDNTLHVYQLNNNKWMTRPNRTSISDPSGIAIAPNGCFIVSTAQNTIMQYDIQNETAQLVAGTGQQGHKDGLCSEAQFNDPRGIVVNEEGTIYICDTGNRCIRQIRDGMVSTIAGASDQPKSYYDGQLEEVGFNKPRVMALDVDGSFIVSDVVDECVVLKRINLKQKLVSVFQNVASEIFCVDKERNLYVCNGNTIRRLQNPWKVERCLWIGCMKEKASYCPLATIPQEIMKQIVFIFRESCKPRVYQLKLTSQQ